MHEQDGRAPARRALLPQEACPDRRPVLVALVLPTLALMFMIQFLASGVKSATTIGFPNDRITAKRATRKAPGASARRTSCGQRSGIHC